MQIIQHQELASSQASITFSSIPQTYTDLYLVCSLRSARATIGDDIVFRFNGDTAANYAWRALLGSGSSVSSSANGSATLGYYGICSASGSTSSTFGSNGLYIPNYTSSTAKSASVDAVSEHNGTESYQFLTANRWSGTAAITSITVFSDTGNNFVQYSSATLYGITKGSDGIVTVS